MKRNPFLWLSVVLLHVVIAAPAFAQMQGSANYSDSWGDSSYIYGSGVTDSPYNNYNHTFRAVTTLRSPSGRVSSYDTGYGSYASAFVSLSFDANDLGLYTVDTDHYDYCPVVFQEIFDGSTGDSTTVALSNTWFFHPLPGPFPKAGDCTYGRECTTTPTCTQTSWTAECKKPWVFVTIPKISGFCAYSKATTVWSDDKHAPDCGDVP